jgi:hypothetical protein
VINAINDLNGLIKEPFEKMERVVDISKNN